MSTTSGLRRLEEIVGKLSGDKALRDEAKAIIRGIIDAQPSTLAWWDRYGPDRPLSPTNRKLFDFVVINGGATKKDLATHLGVDEDSAYRYVGRAHGQFLDRGGKATISWDGSGVARTATISVVVSSLTTSRDRTRLS